MKPARVVLLVLLFSSLFYGAAVSHASSYKYKRVGSDLDAQTHTDPGIAMMGGGSDLDEAKLKTFALANAPAYQHPRSIWFVDSLPLASTNKLDRKTMEKMATERLRQRDTGLKE